MVLLLYYIHVGTTVYSVIFLYFSQLAAHCDKHALNTLTHMTD